MIRSVNINLIEPTQFFFAPILLAENKILRGVNDAANFCSESTSTSVFKDMVCNYSNQMDMDADIDIIRSCFEILMHFLGNFSFLDSLIESSGYMF
jgi:hypothetical protein